MNLRPCDHCAGVLAPRFYVLRLSLTIITTDGHEPEQLTHAEPTSVIELFLCEACYHHHPNDILALTEHYKGKQKEANYEHRPSER